MNIKWIGLAAGAVSLTVLTYAQDAIQTLKVNVEMVQVHASVTDGEGRFVRDLKRDQFEVLEDGVPQKIEAFASDDAPLSVGIVLDVNGTMKANLPLAKEGAMAFLSAGNLDNEYFLVEFDNKAELTEDFTHDLLKLRNHNTFLPSNRDKAVYDGVFAALDKLHDGIKPRKVLLVLTSGGDDTKAEHTAAQIRNLARQLDAEIFSVDLPPEIDIHGEFTGMETTADLIEPVGGRNFVSTSGTDYLNICRRIAVSLRNEYDIAYHSTNNERNGKYRHIAVKLHPPHGAPALFVQARDGYYAGEP